LRVQWSATVRENLPVLRLRGDAIGIALVLLLALLSLCLRVWLLIPYRDNFDEGVYWASLRSLSNGHAIFSDVFSSQPPLFLLTLLSGFKVLGSGLISARAFVLLLSFVGLISVHFMAKSIAGRPAGWIAVLLLASNPRYLALSSTVTAEVPAVAFELLTIALTLAASRSVGRRQLVLVAVSGAALAVGTLTKLFVVVAAIPALFYLLGGARGRSLGASARLLGAFAGGGLLVTAGVLAPLWSRREALYDQVIGVHLHAAAPGSGPLMNLKMLVLPGVQTPLYLLALVVLALLIRRRRVEVIPPLLWGLASLAFLLRLQPLVSHHHVLLTPPAVLIIALAPLVFGRPRQAGENQARYGRGASAIAAAVILVMALGTATTLYRARQPSGNLAANKLMAAELRAVTSPDDLVVSDEPYVVAMADRQVPPPLVDTSYVRLRSGSLDEADIKETIITSGTRAVLFTGGRFEKVPGLRQWVHANFRLASSFGAMRALYILD
jgi:4-amino-4-deoxy-L-arabinose transferase-like glycosyltransferase